MKIISRHTLFCLMEITKSEKKILQKWYFLKLKFNLILLNNLLPVVYENVLYVIFQNFI